MIILRKVVPVSIPLMRIRYQFTQVDWEHFPRMWNTKSTKKEKRILYGKKDSPLPRYIADLNDTLALPGMTQDRLLSLYRDFL